MIEGKNYLNVDSGFLFLAGLIDKWIACMKEAPLTNVYVLYPRVKLRMTTDDRRKRRSKRQLMELKYSNEQIERSLVSIFSHHYNFGLYMPKRYVPDYVVEDRREFGTFLELDASLVVQ